MWNAIFFIYLFLLFYYYYYYFIFFFLLLTEGHLSFEILWQVVKDGVGVIASSKGVDLALYFYFFFYYLYYYYFFFAIDWRTFEFWDPLAGCELVKDGVGVIASSKGVDLALYFIYFFIIIIIIIIAIDWRTFEFWDPLAGCERWRWCDSFQQRSGPCALHGSWYSSN